MTTPNHTPYWACLCPVDPLPLIRWLEGEKAWSAPPSPDKPQRLYEDALPTHLVQPIVQTVLACWPGQQLMADGAMLGRMKPGQSHPFHTDVQRADWLTRVHVPLVTNPGAWHAFEDDEWGRFYMRVGEAYSFNTLARHAFGNEGDGDRVHLMFDVRRVE